MAKKKLLNKIKPHHKNGLLLVGLIIFATIALIFLKSKLIVNSSQNHISGKTQEVPPTASVSASPSPSTATSPTKYFVSPTITQIPTSIPPTQKPTNSQPSSPTSTPTPTYPPFSIQRVTPGYLPEDYSSSNSIKIQGSGFQTGATAFIEGPYELDSGAHDSSFGDYPIQSIVVTPQNYIDGIVAPGLPAGYFKIIVKNPDGSTTSSGYVLLHQGTGHI
ncbi:MAG TPA: hypothetical protein VHE53_03945 [Patescibacteria group bacterium]|nr:hypothetical protein [Patescibacteria group bacterium]